MKKFRKVETFGNYFEDFFVQQNQRIKDKIIWTLELVEDIDKVPKKYFDYIEDGIYEIRIKVGSNIFRILCFFDDGKLIILLNAFQKKTQKTPRAIITKAKKLRRLYYEENEKDES